MAMQFVFGLGIALVFAASLPCPVYAQGNLRRQSADANTKENVEAVLLDELAGTFRAGATKDNILKLEAALGPMYSAVPQEANGRLNHAVVRYMLHRFFAQRGWFIRGLEPSQNSSREQALQELQEWVPSFLQSFLEQLSGGGSLSLREVAVLAGTLEDLIHKEALQRLEQSFKALHLPLNTKLDPIRAREVLEVYMMIYMLGGNFSAKGPSMVRQWHQAFVGQVKDWGKMQQWIAEIKDEVHPPTGFEPTSMDFAAAGQVVERIGERYGSYNEKECAILKSELLSVESEKAGRVRLSEFYKKGLKGVFEFTEKIEYLRVLGAVDETDPKQPHVIVPNYVGSRPNCLIASSFYVICCHNECENLMSALEREVGNEKASPEQILKEVRSLRSATVAAPRTLSEALINRLYGIAKTNGGKVPLHGRLFAQWMHHAYPRECPYPHGAGTVSPQTPDEWMKETGHQDSKASPEEMKYQVEQDSCTTGRPVGEEARKQHVLAENDLPWDEMEELLLPEPQINSTVPAASTGVRQDDQIHILRNLMLRQDDKIHILRNLMLFGVAAGIAFRISMAWRSSASQKTESGADVVCGLA